MADLTQIIKDDFRPIGQAVRGMVIGAVQGIYAPLLITTYVNQATERGNDKSEIERVTQHLTRFASLGVANLAISMYAFEHGNVLEYFGALAITNTIDYLAHAYRRSKDLKPKF